ncbi:hypothetical protein DSO57_1009779 [Entomophthora muscae]|uniref:Uncharacterized protein n=1 Tax=Entomophthora muscae TaxID=34485 RepID=A0ACC2S8P6_9FUNG|nr:hypothetical protein DSO57_1009779 [Entomophthora muscae]
MLAAQAVSSTNVPILSATEFSVFNILAPSFLLLAGDALSLAFDTLAAVTKYVFSAGSEYSLLDCLLNHGKFYLFKQCLTHILSSLGLQQPVPDAKNASSRASSPEPKRKALASVPALHRPAS